MKVTYIHHSCFLVETDNYYYLFDYEKGSLPDMDINKPVFVLSSHGHADHYNSEIFPLLKSMGMRHIKAIMSDDIVMNEDIDTLYVSPNKKYNPASRFKLTTFESTDLGVAFLIEEEKQIIYHAGDLNDWIWNDESEEYNRQMTIDYHKQIKLLSDELNHRTIDTAFVVLDPRQEEDYDKGLCYFLENIPVKKVYPMHYWEKPDIIDLFLKDHPEYLEFIQRTE